MFAIGAAALIARSEDEPAYVAGESGFATFGAVALVAAVFLAKREGVAHGPHSVLGRPRHPRSYARRMTASTRRLLSCW